MIFTSLFKLAETKFDDVFAFLCKLCDEDYEEMSLTDFHLLEAALHRFNKYGEKSFHNFIHLLEGNKELTQRLSNLAPNGKYGFFINGKDTNIDDLNGKALILVTDYIGLFGYQSLIRRSFLIHAF